SGHGEGAMGCATLDGELGILPEEETVDQARGEGVAAAYAVEDFEIFAILGLIKLAIVVANGAPVIGGGGFGFAQSGGDYLERKIFYNLGDHLLEIFGFESGEMLVDAGNFITERGGKIFFVAEHDVNVG